MYLGGVAVRLPYLSGMPTQVFVRHNGIFCCVISCQVCEQHAELMPCCMTLMSRGRAEMRLSDWLEKIPHVIIITGLRVYKD